MKRLGRWLKSVNVEFRRYDIIYNLTNDIKAILEGRLKPEEKVVELGRALVKQVFSISRVGTIAGCYVAQGTIERGVEFGSIVTVGQSVITHWIHCVATRTT